MTMLQIYSNLQILQNLTTEINFDT